MMEKEKNSIAEPFGILTALELAMFEGEKIQNVEWHPECYVMFNHIKGLWLDEDGECYNMMDYINPDAQFRIFKLKEERNKDGDDEVLPDEFGSVVALKLGLEGNKIRKVTWNNKHNWIVYDSETGRWIDENNTNFGIANVIPGYNPNEKWELYKEEIIEFPLSSDEAMREAFNGKKIQQSDWLDDGSNTKSNGFIFWNDSKWFNQLETEVNPFICSWFVPNAKWRVVE